VKLLIGEHYCFDTSNMDDIIGQFNSQLSGKLVVIGDELIAYAGFRKSDAIKAMTTSKNINVTKKGVDTIQESSFHRYIFTTNNIETLRITNDDRRILVLGVSDTKKGDFKYFRELKEEMSNPDNIKKVFEYLMNYDLTGFDFRKAPVTKLKEQMIVSQLDDVYDWFVQYAEDQPIIVGEIRILRSVAYDDYCEYTKSKMRPKDFTAKLEHLLKCEYKKFQKGRYYVFKIDATNKLLMKLMRLTRAPLGQPDDSGGETSEGDEL